MMNLKQKGPRVLIFASISAVCLYVTVRVPVLLNQAVPEHNAGGGLPLTTPSSAATGIHVPTTQANFNTTLMTNAQDLPKNQSPPKIVLFWTAFFGGQNSFLTGEGEKLKYCRFSNCLMTDNKSLWNSSDALIFHPLDFNPWDLPPARHPHQYYIFFVLESPHHSNSGPEGFFNLTFTYRLDSDIIADNYLQYFHPTLWSTEDDFSKLWKSKTRDAVIFASNCGTPSGRQEYVDELKKYIPVDVYGDCGDKFCPKNHNECANVVRWSKFYLAFENSKCKDYISEKVIRAYNTDALPVVMGGGNYLRIFPPHSFIDEKDFESPKKLAEHLIAVASNKSSYAEYFRWRFQPQYVTLPEFLDPQKVSLCKLCEMLHAENKLHKAYNDLSSWWNKGGNCTLPSVNPLGHVTSNIL